MICHVWRSLFLHLQSSRKFAASILTEVKVVIFDYSEVRDGRSSEKYPQIHKASHLTRRKYSFIFLYQLKQITQRNQAGAINLFYTPVHSPTPTKGGHYHGI